MSVLRKLDRAGRQVGSGTSARRDSREWVERHATVLGPLVALVLMSVLFSILAPDTFPTWNNWRNILSQMSVLAVLATGLTFVLLLGQIDLGVANIAVLGGVTSSVLYAGRTIGLPIVGQVSIGAGNQIVAIGVTLLLCTSLGLLAGTITARFGLPSFIATLGILEVAQGLAFYWSNGEITYDIPPVSDTLGGGFLGSFPAIALSAIVIMVIGHGVLSRTTFGRQVYMVGANATAAQLSGIRTRRVVITVFAISGLLAGTAGVLSIGRLGSAQANSGGEFLLPALAAVVLGGTSLFGGVGGMKHTAVGVLLYGVLNNGLDQIDLNVYLKPFARGGFLLIAIIFNVAALRVATRPRTGPTSDEAERQPTSDLTAAAR